MRRIAVATVALAVTATFVVAADRSISSATPASQTGVFPVPAVPQQQQQPVSMKCTGTRVDINHAALLDLSRGLRVSEPVARRIIEHRPFLRTEELAAVPGVSGPHLAGIIQRGDACATPTSLPPQAPDVCVAADQIDINSPSSREALTRVFGRPTADRIFAAQPHYALNNLVRIPGVGPGNLEHNRSALCSTPPPIDVAGATDKGVRYSWAYSSAGGRNDFDGYALVAPAGVIDDVVGGWLQITPLPVPAALVGPAYPSADFHIHAAWSGDNDLVYVSMPDASFSSHFDSGWQRTLLHWSDDARDGGEVVHGDRITVDPVTHAVTGAVHHLSPIDWAMHKANWLTEPAYGVLFGNKFPGPGCPERPWDEVPETNLWTRLGHDLRISGARLDLPGNEVPYSGFPIKHCVQTAGDFDAQAILRNSTGTVAKLDYIAADVRIGDDGEMTADVIDYAVTHMHAGESVFLAPGADGTATVPPGTWGRVDMTSDVVRSYMLLLGDRLLEEFFAKFAGDEALAPTVRELAVARFGCAYDIAASAGGSAVNALRDVFDALRDCFTLNDYLDMYNKISAKLGDLVSAGTISQDRYRQLMDSLLDLREAVKILRIGGLVIGLGEPFAWEASSPITLEHFDASPGFDADGNILGPGCVRRSGYTWVIDDACQEAFLASLVGQTNQCDSDNLQCTWGGAPTGSDSGDCDPFAGSGGLQPAAPGCVLWTSGFTWCGLGQCLPWPDSALHVVRLTDGRSMFIDANGGAWHLPTIDSYWSCVNTFGLYNNLVQHQYEGKWYPQNLVNYQFMGDLYGCS